MYGDGASNQKSDARKGVFRQKCDRIGQRYKLSDREAEVLAFLAQGRSSTKIQTSMGLSKNTVNSYISHIYSNSTMKFFTA
jgi:DNA-binding CsgD family transcriptional regulator